MIGENYRDEHGNTYLHGLCMKYAVSLARETKGILVGIFSKSFDKIPRHVGVFTPYGHYADVRSWTMTEEEFQSGFNQNEETWILEMTEDRVREIWGFRIEDWDVPEMKEKFHEVALSL